MIFLLSCSAYRFVHSDVFPALKMLFVLDIFIYVTFTVKISKPEFPHAPLSAFLTARNNSENF
jgi:hypothetical protein